MKNVQIRKPLLALLIATATLLLIALALPLLIDATQFRPAIESELAKSLGRDVKIGQLKLSILSGTVTADDLSVGDDSAFSRTPFLHAKALMLSVDLWHLLFSRQLIVNEVTIETPETVLLQSPAGVWNFSSLGGNSSAQLRTTRAPEGKLTLSMKSLNINGARLSLTQGRGQP
jgi:AsmA protein